MHLKWFVHALLQELIGPVIFQWNLTPQKQDWLLRVVETTTGIYQVKTMGQSLWGGYIRYTQCVSPPGGGGGISGTHNGLVHRLGVGVHRNHTALHGQTLTSFSSVWHALVMFVSLEYKNIYSLKSSEWWVVQVMLTFHLQIYALNVMKWDCCLLIKKKINIANLWNWVLTIKTNPSQLYCIYKLEMRLAQSEFAKEKKACKPKLRIYY